VYSGYPLRILPDPSAAFRRVPLGSPYPRFTAGVGRCRLPRPRMPGRLYPRTGNLTPQNAAGTPLARFMGRCNCDTAVASRPSFTPRKLTPTVDEWRQELISWAVAHLCRSVRNWDRVRSVVLCCDPSPNLTSWAPADRGRQPPLTPRKPSQNADYRRPALTTAGQRLSSSVPRLANR
jgi:hypothetical protein